MKFGLLHPGQMGSSVAQALVNSGHQGYWLSLERSAETAERATSAELAELDSLPELCAQVDAIVSVCPPEFAESVAQAVAAQDYDGWYLDANAISPMTAERISRSFGERYVDGGIIGPPAKKAGTTRLYLSGSRAEQAARWFTSGPLAAVSLTTLQRSVPTTAASLVKMTYAAYSKGMSALLLDVCALAEAGGVSAALEYEWQQSQPQLLASAQRAASVTAAKAWRFVAEMREIESTFAAYGLPSGFHAGAAAVYASMGSLRNATDADLNAVIQALCADPSSTHSVG